MFKKILNLIKFLFVTVFWSALWLSLMRFVILRIWNFDILSLDSWQTISIYWKKGGTIKSAFDYMLFVTFLVVVILWYKGIKRLYQVNFVKLLLKPFDYFSKKQIEKFERESKHITIKNLVVGEKITLDDLIEEKIKEEGNTQSQKESQNLRENISKKITERKGQ